MIKLILILKKSPFVVLENEISSHYTSPNNEKLG